MSFRLNIKRYVLVCLFVLMLTGALSLLYSAGYVYIYWGQWQLQSSLYIWVVLIVILGLTVYVLGQILKRIYRNKTQYQQYIAHFQQLYRYEQMGVLYLLSNHQQEDALKVFKDIHSRSILLSPLFNAQYAMQQQDYRKAKRYLNYVPVAMQAMQQLSSLELAILQKDEKNAFLLYSQLQQMPMQGWLKDVKSHFQKKLQGLGETLIKTFPQSYLAQYHQNEHLKYILAQCTESSLIEILHILLKEKDLDFSIDDLATKVESFRYQHQQMNILWLQVLAQYEYPHLFSAYAEQTLNHNFNETIFIEWFAQRLETAEIVDIEQQVLQWLESYPYMAVLNFAYAYILLQTQRSADAEQLIQQYVSYPLMKYLALVIQLKHTDESMLLELRQIIELHYPRLKLKF